MTDLVDRTPHGVLVLHAIDATVERTHLIARLHPEEAALTSTWGDARVRTFASGRLALREALAQLGVDVAGPILRSARGAPVLPAAVRASVSHKDRVAAALAALTDPSAHVGVDIEETDVQRRDVTEYVLTADEIRALRMPHEMLIRFSLKEALYKAVDPTVQRYVGFHEVEVAPLDDGTARFTLALKNREGPFVVDGRWRVHETTIVTSVVVRHGP